MAKTAAIRPDEKVLEIGTGKGVLTKKLDALSRTVEAFELDERNFAATRSLGLRNVTLRHGDAFSSPRTFDVLVSSLPYSESSNFVEWLAGLRYDRAIVMLQKDFVEKLNSSPGEDGYRAVSLISQISSYVVPLHDVGRESFLPPPRVNSVVASIRPRRSLSPEEIRGIKLLFSQKRRKLEGALKRLGLKASGLDSQLLEKRVEKLTPDEVFSVLESVRTSSL